MPFQRFGWCMVLSIIGWSVKTSHQKFVTLIPRAHHGFTLLEYQLIVNYVEDEL